jgi:bacillithiol biosynthesis cysteine-adding enzyme BshC
VNPSIFDAYIEGRASAFFAGHYADREDRLRSIERASRPVSEPVLQALVRQNAQFAASPARTRHIEALRGGALCVVTGQQAGLFLGPLFTLYKAATAVAAARALENETGRPVVPLFWLQTEDHDLPEIAQCHVPSERGGPLSLCLPAAIEDRVSVAHRYLPIEVRECLTALRAELGNLPHAGEHLARLEHHYRPGAGWATAFAGVLAELFAEEGLVLFDPREPELAAVAAAIHRRALSAAGDIAGALQRRSKDLEAAGFAATVHVRDGAPLSFFHPRGALGPRYRLVPDAAGFAEVGGEHCHALPALLHTLATEPLCFSTSVLLRPILQDSFLPTAAFVGGPAEVSYFAQLAPLYEAFGLPMPIVVPRARLSLIEPKTARLLDRRGLRAIDAERSEDELLAAARHSLPAQVAPADLSRALVDSFVEKLEDLRPTIAADAPEVAAALDKTRHSVEGAVAKLTAKYERALLHHDERLVAEVRRLKDLLWPAGMPQERFYGVSYFAARYGESAFVRRIVGAIVPFDATPRELLLRE